MDSCTGWQIAWLIMFVAWLVQLIAWIWAVRAYHRALAGEGE